MRRIYKNRTHVRAHSGTHYARVHARFDEENCAFAVSNRRIHASPRGGEHAYLCTKSACTRETVLARSPSDRVITRALVLLDAWSDSQTSPSLPSLPSSPHLSFSSPFSISSFRFLAWARKRGKTVKVCAWTRILTDSARERKRDGLLTRCPFSIKCNDSTSRWKSVSSPEGYNLRSTKIVSRLHAFCAREFEDSISNTSPVRAFLPSILDFPRDLLLTVIGCILADFYLLLRKLPAILPLLVWYFICMY